MEALYIGRIRARLEVAFVSEFTHWAFASDFFNLLLVKFHLAETITVKHLLQKRNNEALVGLNSQPCDHGRHKNGAPNNCAMLPTLFCLSFIKDRW